MASILILFQTFSLSALAAAYFTFLLIRSEKIVVCPKRKGSWWQGRVYGEDGALNPASNNHYQLGTGSLISGKSKLAAKTRPDSTCQRKLREITLQI